MRVLLQSQPLYRGVSFLVPLAFVLQLACGGGGGGSAPAPAPAPTPVVTVPTAPSSLVVTVSSAASLTLTWTDNATNETGFKIERGTSAAGPFTQVATTTANLAAYTDTGLSASTAYYYQVRATNTAGDSTYTSVASATTSAAAVLPAAPSSLLASATSTTAVALTWTDNSSNETGFLVERSTSATGTFTQIGTTSVNGTSYTDGSLAPGATYFYRVRATNGAGNSAYTAVATATTPTVVSVPTAPAGLTATAGAAGSITLGWTDTSTNELSFKVERGTAAAGPFTQIGNPIANVVNYYDTGLAASTAYFYRVCASNSAGDSLYTAVASATTISGVVVPAAPSNLAASFASATSISLMWTDNSTNETGFKVERSSSSFGPYSQIALTAANTAAYSDNGLTPATTYYYQVRATNSAGDSNFSIAASATTPASVSVPAAPTGLVATATSITSIGLSWTDNSTNETGFKIERSTSATGTFTLIATNSADIANYADTGLSSGVAYYYRVRSTNGAGDSANTAVATATTPAAVTIPAAPSGLVAAAISTSGINLTWLDNSTNETGFKIERSTSSAGTYVLIGTNAANNTTFGDSGLASSTTYYYRVRATNGAGDSANTVVASATTQTPAPVSYQVTLYPTQDNLIMKSTWDSTVANKVYSTGELAVGTNWTTYLDPFGTFMQTYVRAESVVQWDVSALSGKTIESATLTLNRQYYGTNQYNWWIVALASTWSTGTVTWNTVNATTFQHYLANQLHLYAPTSNTTVYDITPIVANWASGTFQNHGLWFSPDVSLMPGVDQLQAFAFYSRESGTLGPALTVTYH